MFTAAYHSKNLGEDTGMVLAYRDNVKLVIKIYSGLLMSHIHTRR